MSCFVVYRSPKDYPGRFVVRRWFAHMFAGHAEVVPMPQPEAVALTLEEARAALPSGLARVPPIDGDDPVIEEIWL